MPVSSISLLHRSSMGGAHNDGIQQAWEGQHMWCYGAVWQRSHLVRHGGGPHFTSNSALLEVAERNVGPGVAVKVQQDVIEAHHSIVQLCYVIMRFNLRQQGSQQLKA